MDEIMLIQSTDVKITSRFFLLLKDLAEGESITLEKSYSTDDLTILEVDSLAAVWDVTLKREIIERFTYGLSEVDDSFGLVSLSFTKNDYSEIGVDLSTEDEQLVSTRTFTYQVKITALQPISSGSLLRI
jgi:hypothetical protein